MNEFLVEEAQYPKGAKIKAIACGGCGGNMINHMIEIGFNSIDLIAANTDIQALEKSLAKTKIQLGEKRTGGLGAGGIPEVGAESARESFEEIKAALDQSDMVFISAGLGGGTGTGSAPIIAQAAKEIGALTVGVVTMPFNFERRTKEAEAGLEELRKECDSILVIQNEKLKTLIDKKAGRKEAFRLVDDILARAVKGMSSVILDKGDINVDFADVRTIMGYRGLALMGVGSAQGENAIEKAIANALECPLLEGMDIKKSKGIILHIKAGEAYSFLEVEEAASDIESKVPEVEKFIFGMTDDDSMGDAVEVTIIATGLENEEDKKKAKPELKTRPDYMNISDNIGIMAKTGTGGYVIEHTDLEQPSFKRYQQD